MLHFSPPSRGQCKHRLWRWITSWNDNNPWHPGHRCRHARLLHRLNQRNIAWGVVTAEMQL